MELLRPWVLVLLIGLLWLGWRYWHLRQGFGDWPQVADPHLLRAMQAMGYLTDGGASLRQGLLLGAASAVVIGLAGPAVHRSEAVVYRNLDGVLFVLDASHDTVSSSAWPSLLAGLRSAVAALGTRPASLIVYAGDAYVALDMTYDTRELGMTAALIEPDTVPNAGNDPARALNLATDLIRQGQLQSGDVVLMSGISPTDAALGAAASFADLPVRFSTLSAEPRDYMALLSVAGGRGQGFALNESRALQTFLSQSPYQELAEKPLPLHHSSDLGRWVLLAALVPLMVLFWGVKV